MLGALAAQQVERVGKDRQDHREVLADAFGAAGEVDDQGAAADAGDGAAEHRHRSVLEAFGAHGFGEAGHFVVKHFARGLRRDVARAEAGAAGGDDEVELVVVGPFLQTGGDRRPARPG